MTFGAIEIFYATLCVLAIIPVLWVNRHLFRGPQGHRTSLIELALAAFGLPALLIGWYHNIAYMNGYPELNGWLHWTSLLFVNPASASAGQDLIFANLFLFPLWNMIEGRRHRMKLWWWYFPMSLLTSYAFGIALFMIMQLRQMRFNEQQAAAA